MRVIVIGAGVVGAASAHFLAKQGHEVTVIERNLSSGMETSFANGGQISACHSVPWSNPTVVKKLMKWVWRGESPLLFRPKLDIHQWKWLISFLGNCNRRDTLYNTKHILNLIQYSKIKMAEIRDETSIKYSHLQKGIIHYYRTQEEFAEGLKDAAYMRDLGLDRKEISLNELLSLEPAFTPIKDQIVGATFTESDESGDVHQFTKNLSNYNANTTGVKYIYGAEVTGFYEESDGKIRVIVDYGESVKYRDSLSADAIVICTASFTNKLLSPLGINLNIYPAKGYSASIKIKAGEEKIAPHVSLTDDETKLVYSRLGNTLRVAGTAELNGYDDRTLNTIRCAELIKQASKTFPELDMSEHMFWTGLRPLTPSNRPYIGSTKYKNVFLNVGHGSLGWSMACGSGALIADIIAGKKLDIDATAFSLGVPH